MEDPEVPLEQAQEHIQHHAEHSPEKRWILGVALSSAILAALAAVASLLAGHHANEALISQIQANNQILKASDQWSYYQAKGIKGAVLSAKVDLLKSLDKPPGPKDEANVARYQQEQAEITAKAEAFQHEADALKEEGEKQLNSHMTLARSVTMFQVSIAIAAVSVLVQRRRFWFLSMAFGCVGIFFLAQELLGEFAKHLD